MVHFFAPLWQLHSTRRRADTVQSFQLTWNTILCHLRLVGHMYLSRNRLVGYIIRMKEAERARRSISARGSCYTTPRPALESGFPSLKLSTKSSTPTSFLWQVQNTSRAVLISFFRFYIFWITKTGSFWIPGSYTTQVRSVFNRTPMVGERVSRFLH